MYSLSQPWHPACCLLWGCTQPMLADFPKKPLLHKGLQSSSCGPGSSHAFKRRNCGSAFEVSEDPQYLEARRNPICHFGVSWYFCAFSSTDCSHSLWTMSLHTLQVCPVPPWGLLCHSFGGAMDAPSFFDTNPCGNHVISIPPSGHVTTQLRTEPASSLSLELGCSLCQLLLSWSQFSSFAPGSMWRHLETF